MALARQRIEPAARALRRLAWTYYLLAGGLGLGCVLPALFMGSELPRGAWVGVLAVAAAVPLSVGTGWGLTRLRRWAVVPAMAIASLMLLVFPLGTLAGGEALYTLVRHRSALLEDATLLDSIPEVGKERIPRWQIIVIAALLTGIVGFLAFQTSR